MFKKILVANRGEIARRIFRACREMGVFTVAIYSEVDRSAPWSRLADESYKLSGVTARDTYLNQAVIFEIAEATGVDAIHPGYGFLSENPDFADACAARDIHFIGPTASSMLILGSKSGARALALKNGVPVIPGLDAIGKTDKELMYAAERIGFPVLIKASLGGGGKGMRVVSSPGEFFDALQAARNESMSSFGSDHILLEKYFYDIRHIEIQVLGDEYGNIIHLFERECSIQRRHQKIIEESPSSVLTPILKDKMIEAALALANDVGYVSAGTLEFVLTPEGNFYFLEMNTRLQVEHPVTELVTNVDLAACQIRAAAGERISHSQHEIQQRGHALECRIYAEDPSRNFLPSIGEIAFYRPASGPGIRVDDGIDRGTKVSPYYDPMLAKVITWGDNRLEAIQRMVRALQDTVILGVTTNIPYLIDILQHPEFTAGRLSTKFLSKNLAPWRPSTDVSNSTRLALAAYEAVSNVGKAKKSVPELEKSTRLQDPWGGQDSWRNSV